LDNLSFLECCHFPSHLDMSFLFLQLSSDDSSDENDEFFNCIHSSIRNVIEPSFGVTMKWQTLCKMPNYPMWKQKMVIVACMVLHNFIREHK
jgi:hypothetical protein